MSETWTISTAELKGIVARLSRWVRPRFAAVDLTTGVIQAEAAGDNPLMARAALTADVDDIAAPMPAPLVIAWRPFAAAVRAMPRRGRVRIVRNEGEVCLYGTVGVHRFAHRPHDPRPLHLDREDVEHRVIVPDRWRSIVDAFPFTSTDENRPILAQVVLGHNGYDVVACDSFTLLVRGWGHPYLASPSVFPVYGGHVYWMRHAVGADPARQVEAWAGATQALACGRYLVAGTPFRPAGSDIDFPNTRSLIPGEDKWLWSATFDTPALVEMLTVAERGMDEPHVRPLRFRLDRNETAADVRWFDQDGGMASSFTIPATIEQRHVSAKSIEVAFNATYLRRCVRPHTGQRTTLRVIDELKPVTVHDAATIGEDDAVTTLAMPVRIQ